MVFQYKNSDKRGNPKIKFINGEWIVEYCYHTSMDKVNQAFSWCELHNSLVYKVGVEK